MRLIAKIKSEEEAKTFSLFLSKQDVDNVCELQVNRDWGSAEYSDSLYLIWVINENDIEKAQDYYQAFKNAPDDPKFQSPEEHIKELLIPTLTGKFGSTKTDKVIDTVDISSLRREKKDPKQGILTLYILLLCASIFIWTSLHDKPYVDAPSYFTPLVITSSPLKKSMLYDYPQAFEILDNLQGIYGIEKLKDPANLPKTGQVLINKYLQTSYWKGLYHHVLSRTKRPELSWAYYGPMFEKIQQGEVWRLITPIFMHGDIFHIFFNMIWLTMLGPQIERRIGFLKYLLFILLCGVLSNTAQYLMSGSSFLGYSGVICGMIGFIYSRQKLAIWEGYQLQDATLNFISFFIFGLAALQTLFFFLEIYGIQGISLPIANTAHISGGVVGYLLGRLNFFAWKQ